MNSLKKEYSNRLDAVLNPLASAIEQHIREHLRGQPRIDRISARAKSIDRFIKKAETVANGSLKYRDPLRQIQDQVGARIITFYRSDVESIAKIVEEYYRPIESKQLVPDSEWEFSYFGRHFVLIVPSDLIDQSLDEDQVPQFFELQIKTLFQHAWSEANHDLGYKPGLVPLDSSAKRRLAFTSAQAWGADHIFDELFQERST